MNPDGEISGFEMDTLQIMVNKVGATLKAEEAQDWLNVKFNDDGTLAFDDAGNMIFIGSIADVYYKRTTFAISQIMLYDYMLVDFLSFDYQPYFIRSAKPDVIIQFFVQYSILL